MKKWKKRENLETNILWKQGRKKNRKCGRNNLKNGKIEREPGEVGG